MLLDAPPDRYTRQRLARLDHDEAACLSVLADAGMRVRLVPDRVTGAGCGFDNAVEIRRSTVGFTSSFTLSCRAALSLALWERHVLAPAAREVYGSEVAHLGIWHLWVFPAATITAVVMCCHVLADQLRPRDTVT